MMNLRLALMLISDALLAAAAFLVAVGLRLGVEALWQGWSDGTLVVVALTFTASSLFSSYLMEIYSGRRGNCPWEIVLKSLQCGCGTFILLAFAYYFYPNDLLARGILFLSISLFWGLQSIWHVVSRSGKEQPSFAKRVLILGTDELARMLGDLVTQRSMFTLVGFLNLGNQGVPTITYYLPPPKRTVECQENLVTTARKEDIDVIVVALPERRGVLPLQEILQCKLSGIEIFDAAGFYEILYGKLMLEHLPLNHLFSVGFGSTLVISMLKRCVDLFISAVILMAFLPLLPLLAIAIKIDSSGPIFNKTVKVGGNEKSFSLYNFKVTFVDEAQKSEASSADDCHGFTAFSRFLRKSGIEQIPQLYNVLIGDMSLVGPRPEGPEFVESLKKDISYYSKRHSIKPGITGWAQVRHPEGSGKEGAIEKLPYDLYYIKNLSPSLDSQIVFEAVKVALFGRGRR